jgi:GNAT superfamily N-acetyltransferase
LSRRFDARPLTPETWADLEELFGRPGGSIVRGCWCVYYRRSGSPPAGPRDDYAKLRRSPVMKPVDDADVWSIVCTYVDRAHRGRGLQHRLVRAGIDFARANGVRLLEAYPVDKPGRSADDFMFFGSRSLYERAGFREVVRRSPTRIVMRRRLRPR